MLLIFFAFCFMRNRLYILSVVVHTLNGWIAAFSKSQDRTKEKNLIKKFLTTLKVQIVCECHVAMVYT